MSDRIFVDTNILIYAHDLDAGSKRKSAVTIMDSNGPRKPSAQLY